MKQKVIDIAKKCKASQGELLQLSSKKRNSLLLSIASSLENSSKLILEANLKDVDLQKRLGLSEALIDRLTLTESRLKTIIESIDQVIALDCPLSDGDLDFTLNSGVRVTKKRVPFGTIGIIYEARPNVTVDTAILCIKAGSSVLLRGSQSAIHSNVAIVKAMQKVLKESNLPKEIISFIPFTDREAVTHMLNLKGILDVIIPRGGHSLIDFVVDNAKVPVIETGAGNCHMYIDADADYNMALKLVLNAKTQRPSVCNSIETVLVNEIWAKENLSSLLTELKENNIELRVCKESLEYCPEFIEASIQDYKTEFLSLTLVIKIVKNVDQAICHINIYGTHHSECIISSLKENVDKFKLLVDSAAVYVNASTRFTDGFEFGFGAEIGISTQKLHARGPMGLFELTTYKYILEGNGEVRE
ncbi:UNVERIFIED_CONTAM: hypothetical protein GTU68_040402 [Idotea baltica]|nr:hypothetical protein [Idotea baltica]